MALNILETTPARRWRNYLNGRPGPLFKISRGTLSSQYKHLSNSEVPDPFGDWSVKIAYFFSVNIYCKRQTSQRAGASPKKSPGMGSPKAREQRPLWYNVSNKTASLQSLFLAQLVLLKIVAQFHKQVGTYWSWLLKYCIPSVASNAQSMSLKITCQAVLLTKPITFLLTQKCKNLKPWGMRESLFYRHVWQWTLHGPYFPHQLSSPWWPEF